MVKMTSSLGVSVVTISQKASYLINFYARSYSTPHLKIQSGVSGVGSAQEPLQLR
jgi:hypothetical protein